MPSKVNVLCIDKRDPGVAAQLAEALGAQLVTAGYRPKYAIAPNGVVINFGRGKVPIWYAEAINNGVHFINHPYPVSLSIDKTLTLNKLSRNHIPALQFTTNVDKALQWLNNGNSIVVRHKTSSYMGDGIEVIHPPANSLPLAPLYTKYYDKTHEFRVYVLENKVIQILEKKRLTSATMKRLGVEQVNEFARTDYNEGWVHAIHDLTCDRTNHGGRLVIEEIAKDATRALGLDWCGVDILAKYTTRGTLLDAVVCETNTAPGIDGPTTFALHVEKFKEIINSHIG